MITSTEFIDSLLRRPVKEVQKDWGFERWFINDKENDLCYKELHIDSGKGFSNHFHDKKQEYFCVKSGRLWVRITDTANREKSSRHLDAGDILSLPRLVPHEVKAPLGDVVITEISTFHDDADSFRI